MFLLKTSDNLHHGHDRKRYTACGLNSDISRPWEHKEPLLSRAVVIVTPFECDHPIERPESVVAARALAHGIIATSGGHAKRVASRPRLPGCPVIAATHLTPTPVAYYGSDKCNDYSCVTFNSFVDNEIRKSTLSGRVLPIMPVSHVTSWLTGR